MTAVLADIRPMHPVVWREFVASMEMQGVTPLTTIRSIDWRKWQRAVVWKHADGSVTVNDKPHPVVHPGDAV